MPWREVTSGKKKKTKTRKRDTLLIKPSSRYRPRSAHLRYDTPGAAVGAACSITISDCLARSCIQTRPWRKKERKKEKKEEWNWAFSRGKTAQSGHCFERTTLHSAFCGQKFKAHITFLLVSASLPTASTLVARGNLKHDRQYFPLVPCLRVTQARSRLNEKQERGRRKRICANSTYVAEKGTKKKITEERDLHLRKVEVLGSFSFFLCYSWMLSFVFYA